METYILKQKELLIIRSRRRRIKYIKLRGGKEEERERKER